MIWHFVRDSKGDKEDNIVCWEMHILVSWGCYNEAPQARLLKKKKTHRNSSFWFSGGWKPNIKVTTGFTCGSFRAWWRKDLTQANLPSLCSVIFYLCLHTLFLLYMRVKVAHLCPTLRPHGLYVPWNSPGRNTEVGSLFLLRGSSQPRDRTQVSRIAGRFFTSWGTREALILT